MRYLRLVENSNYLISELGDVFNIIKCKFLKLSVNKNGYVVLDTQVQRKRKIIYVHRIVAILFLPNPNNLPSVNHKDGNKQNNNISNLEWVTNKQNCKHAWDTGLQVVTDKLKEHGKRTGAKYGKNLGEKYSKIGSEASRLVTSKKVVCLQTNKKFQSIKEAAEYLGISAGYLSIQLNGKYKNSTTLVFFDTKKEQKGI